MGVKGLWKLIESAGVPVPLETLENKVLGVDVSIWLHQAVRGFRGPGGAAVANAHLLTLFHRICKLLFYRIRPVFVFDGRVPHLKKQTLASRKLRREVATSKARQVRERLLKNLLKSQAVRNALGRSGPGPSSVHVLQVTKREKDLFELPPLPDALAEDTSVKEEQSTNTVQSFNLPNLHHFDLESEEFKSMSLEMKHEILSELQDTRKQNSWATINDMPQQSENFADFQMARLMQRAKFQSTLDSTRDEIQKVKLSEMEVEMFGELEKYMSLSRRIISEDASHAIFVKKVKENVDNNSESIDAESDVSITKGNRKGKAPLRKKKNLDKDFLTELAKVGIIQHSQQTDSDLEDESDHFYPLHDDWNDSEQQCSKVEEESFLQVVGTLMENSGLTQDEILTLIKQGQKEKSVHGSKMEFNDGPSTSANAPGSIFNPDVDSSDDDDLIEVSSNLQSPQVEGGDKKENRANNIDKLLETKTNSLWMKIVQQKVDDMVHVSALKASPKKAIIDSRRCLKEKVNNEHKNPKNGLETLKPVKISLDFEVKPLKMEDNIFSDIFTDLVCHPEAKKNHGVMETQGSKDTGGHSTNLQASVGHVDAVKHKEGSPPYRERSEYDGVEIMSSSDESEDEHHSPVSTHLPSPLTKNKKQQQCLPTQDLSEHDRTDIMQHMSPRNTSSRNEKKASSKSTVYENEGRCITERGLATNIVYRNKCTHNTESVPPKVIVTEDQKLGNTQQLTGNGMSPIDQDTGATNLLKQNCIIKDTGNLSISKPSIISINEGSCIEVENGSAKEIGIEDNKPQQQGLRVTPLSVSNSDGSSETMMYKSAGSEHTRSNCEAEVVLLDNGDNTEGSMHVEAKSHSNHDVDVQQKGEGSSSAEEIENEEFDRPLQYTEDELKHLEGELASEQQALVAQAQRSERLASSLNDQMYGESQYLLQLFGIPYLVAPMEAEAQCAFLNSANLTEGTITDDSDIFLFGGNSVYRNFFNQTRHVEHFKTDNIIATLGLDRPKMITLALLTGSDYTEGIEGIGSVSAMEILAEFPGEGIQCLQNLRKWWNVAHKRVTTTQFSKIKQKLVQVNLPDSFPNDSVYEAYLAPEVDESKEKFTWAVPNVEALRIFTGEKFGWNSDKSDEILLPVIKKLKVKTSQKRIESYFTTIRLVKELKVSSKRMQDAIAKAKGIKVPECMCVPGKSLAQARPRPKQKRKVIKDLESKPVGGESNQSSETVQETRPTKPRRTLLVDTSEIKLKSVIEGKRGQKRKKDSGEENLKRKKNSEEEQSQSTTQKSKTNNISQRKLTKEDIFKSLLEKETICQREKEKLEMQEKKLAAAHILQNQKKEKKSKER